MVPHAFIPLFYYALSCLPAGMCFISVPEHGAGTP
ncbi:hypothetical protein CLOBOL_06621 [Enterocloster bolteae ATCC BAA-613]|uniref:Uncharacterized protein n=1 Tax=Enterocloster bolteae (strain ATCC BAA-613 / DSM 15670 / CCUG 46953 / JCM 12243 / WAL 16351) TaxID=411902 RepID=A8S3H9_ENTBW|nr:hypothetical protein CLOBOL_06621 [Enterocloster bolteae ATCC BAA-613]